MSPPAHSRPDEDDEPEEEEDDAEEEEPGPRRRARPQSRSSTRRQPRPPMRRWRASADEEEEEEDVAAPEKPGPAGKKPIYWRARDSLFFEPLVALAIIVVLLVSLFAYTQNWPPVYVVESGSMQHGSADQLGLINTGDLVLAEKVPTSSITPYVTGQRTGYSTYGEYGDVLLYSPNGQSGTPIIHRAILFMQWDPGGWYNVTDLTGLPCGVPGAVYATPGTPASSGLPAGCATTHLTGTLDLFNIGWKPVNISLDLSAPALGEHSGFLTMGDNNSFPDQTGSSTPAISSLVEPGWIVGVARGMIPWFGALKLLLEGNAGEVPPQSWEYLGITVAGIILAAFGIHYALRTEGIETPLRRKEEEVARVEHEAEAGESAPRRWFSKLRRHHPDDEEESAAPPPKHHRTRPPPSPKPSSRGRPAPHVRRPPKPAKKSDEDDDEL